jgi:hypothetical protein
MAIFCRFYTFSVLFNLKRNWSRFFNFCVNWEHIFTSFSMPYRWAILHQNLKNLLAVDREGFSLPYFFSHLFLSARSPAIPTFYTHNPLKSCIIQDLLDWIIKKYWRSKNRLHPNLPWFQDRVIFSVQYKLLFTLQAWHHFLSIEIVSVQFNSIFVCLLTFLNR